ncbi:hypothetical protein ABIC28_005055 [Rhodococcus sp. PvR044]|uniref:DUF3027 domain-containing protein n=1 Tax=Rhodococcus TaxID=1827 RepID=UPI001B5FE86C|nr:MULTISPECIES: DUF3027 domain-containing protein [Rhodococcus]MBP1160495.1 hypothetical protein [Rhodococcus sp. PvR099]MCZ4556231.1 DUF3027 domain-containing protein [Rhodococcus maanshanensis]
MSAQSAPELAPVRPVLADAVDLARQALIDLGEGEVGAHLGVTSEGECAATHRFSAQLPGYRGWQWAVVLAADPESDRATVSELALLPGPDALTAPDWLPWDERIRPGDLSPGDLLAPLPSDPRLVPGYVATGDPAVDEVALEVGLGRKQVMSLEGRLDAAERWREGDYGPDSEMAKAAPSTCELCGFYLPLSGSLKVAFGVCGNEMAADGHVVYAEYGCGAHSDTTLPTGAGSPQFDAYDDGAVEMVALPEPKVEAPAAGAVTDEVPADEVPAAEAPADEAPTSDAAGEPASTD